MTASCDRTGRIIAFVLLTYRPDEPAYLARSIAALAAGLREMGHRAVIVTAFPQRTADADVIELTQLPVAFPCAQDVIRHAVRDNRDAVAAELTAILIRCDADTVVYADPILGLGRLASVIALSHPAMPVLLVHSIARHFDLTVAARAARRVIAPSASIIAQAGRRGHDTAHWTALPSPLLVDPDDVPAPDSAERQRLRQHGPVRAAARLDINNGISALLRTATPAGRAFQLTLATGSLESVPGCQRQLLECCHALAWRSGAQITPALPWRDVPAFLAGAAVTVVPARGSASGLVALESLSSGTPVVGYHAGSLPEILGHGTSEPAGVLLRAGAGPRALWQAVRQILADDNRYRDLSRAAQERSHRHRAVGIAARFLDILQ